MTDQINPTASPNQRRQPLLELRDLSVSFQTSAGPLEAVRGANLVVYPGQTVAIVGESGSGKSTTAHAVIGLLPGTGKVTGGQILFDGKDIASISEKEFVKLRGSKIGMVPQDPMSNLNPVWKIGFQVREALKANNIDVSRSTYQHLVDVLSGEKITDTPEGRLYLGSKGRNELFTELRERPGIDLDALDKKLVVGFSTRMEVTAALRLAGLDDADALAVRYVTGCTAKDRVAGLLSEAGLPDAARRARQYPHEFSGGMRQRALIAMGLAARPALLIADEPTSALDVTVQRQILDHLGNLTKGLDTATLLITHDLGLAAERAEHLVVMYRGEIVESGPSLGILQAPRHPYTQRLVAAAPSLSSRRMTSAKVAAVPA
ncbi:MAG: ABC transporter ATP-binding protein, partial [Bifidobacteriaceae bacterium]|nr:ABC transporter ATP-binding protein [Bifidobacteriaceae bacterium]